MAEDKPYVISNISSFDEWDGIALSIEVLEKCGFTDRSGSMKNRLGFGLPVLSAFEFCWYVQDGFLRFQTTGSGFTTRMEHIQYLHQLQNLYFSLTGTELIINITNNHDNRKQHC